MVTNEVQWRFDRLHRTHGKGQNYGSWITNGTHTFSGTNSRVTIPETVRNYRVKIKQCRAATSELIGEQYYLSKVPISGYTSRERTRVGNPNLVITSEERGFWGHTFLSSLSDPATIDDQSVRNAVLSDIVSQIRSAQTSLQGLVSLGELGETVRLLNSSGKGMMSVTHGYLNDCVALAQRVSPRRLARAVAGRWLEYSFGVKPLIKDIDSAINGFVRLREQQPPRKLVRYSRSMKRKETPQKIEQVSEASIADLTLVKESRYGYKMYGAVSLADYADRPVSHEFGMTLDAFAPTLWELIPYSFLSDYFLNLGDIIDAWSLNKTGISWMNYGEIRENSQELTCHSLKERPFSGWVYNHSVEFLPSTVRIARKRVHRAPYSGSYIPSLEFKVPGVSLRWLNMAALGTQHATASKVIRDALRGRKRYTQ